VVFYKGKGIESGMEGKKNGQEQGQRSDWSENDEVEGVRRLIMKDKNGGYN
jgi:hypothetical protein